MKSWNFQDSVAIVCIAAMSFLSPSPTHASSNITHIHGLQCTYIQCIYSAHIYNPVTANINPKK